MDGYYSRNVVPLPSPPGLIGYTALSNDPDSVQIVERSGQMVGSKCKLFLDITPDCTVAKYLNVNFSRIHFLVK